MPTDSSLKGVTAETGAIEDTKPCPKDKACYTLTRKYIFYLTLRVSPQKLTSCPRLVAVNTATFKGVMPEPPLTIELKGETAEEILSYHFTNAASPLKNGLVTGIMLVLAAFMASF